MIALQTVRIACRTRPIPRDERDVTPVVTQESLKGLLLEAPARNRTR